MMEPSSTPHMRDDLPPRAPPFRHVFEAEFGYIWRSLRNLGVFTSDLEDVAHEVFVVIYKHFGEYDPSRPLRPWLFGFAAGVAANYRRAARHRREVLDIEPTAIDATPAADDRVATMERFARVSAVLDQMDFKLRAVLVMHELEGHTAPEIAEALSIPLNTAYSRLRLARNDFAARLAQLEGSGGMS